MHIQQKQRITQLVLERVLDSTNIPTKPLRGPHGFGSSDTIKTSDDHPLSLSLDPYGSSMNVAIKNTGTHPTRGIVCRQLDATTLQLQNCAASTPATRISRWKSTLQNSIINAINGVPVHTLTDLQRQIELVKEKEIRVNISPALNIGQHPQDNVPILHFDQLLAVSHQHNAAINDTAPLSDPLESPFATEDDIIYALNAKKLNSRLSQKFLQRQSDWDH